MPIINVADVLDCTTHPATFYKVIVKTVEGKAVIAKCVPNEEKEGQYILHEVMSKPVMELTFMMDQYERYLYNLGQRACIVTNRPVLSNKKE